MKNFLLASVLLISIGVSAQSSYGYYGLHNMNNGLREGWGFDMNGLSSSLTKQFPIAIQAGLGYNILWAGQKNFDDVVLADGETPRDVSFTNMFFNLSGTIRVSVPSPNGRFSPYAEVSPGLGMSTSTVDIHDEDNVDNCYTRYPNKTIGFNLGASTGMLIRLNDTWSVDAGMTWDKNYNRGNMIMMNSVDLSDGISYGMKAAPSSVVCFLLGVRINLSTDDCCSYSGCTVKRHHKTCGHTELPHR